MLIKIPKLVGSKKLSPYEQLYHLVCKRLGYKWEIFKRDYTVSDISVNKKTGRILRGNETEWQWKNWDKKFMGKGYFLRKVFPWHFLNYSPREQEGIADGKVEVVLKKAVKSNK